MQVRLCKTAGAACLLVLLLALLVIGESAAGQPTPEQVSAIKSNCRSDFMANCRGVPRGGAEAVQCLKQHLANLSPGCQNAVQAISPPAAPRPESPPAEPAPAPPQQAAPARPAPAEAAPAPAAKPPASPPAAAKEPPPATKPAAETPQAPAPKAAAPATPEAEPPVIGFIPPRKQLMVLRNCRQDLSTYCADVAHGEGRQLRCLLSHRSALTPDCQGALAKLTR